MPNSLALILRALCSAATKNPVPSRMLLFSFVKNENLWFHMDVNLQSWVRKISMASPYVWWTSRKTMKRTKIHRWIFRREEKWLAPNEYACSARITKIFAKIPRWIFYQLVHEQWRNCFSIVPVLQQFYRQYWSWRTRRKFHGRKGIGERFKAKTTSWYVAKAKEKLPQDTPLSKAWGGKMHWVLSLRFWSRD